MKDNKTESLFGDDIYTHRQSGTVALPNNMVRGNKRLMRKEVKRGNQVYEIPLSTKNDKKIEDTCIEIFQSKEIKDGIDINNYIKIANEELDDVFLKHKLIESPENSKTRNDEIRNIKKIAINDHIKKNLQKFLPKEIEFPLKEFISRTGIARIQNRTGEALALFSDASSKNNRSWNKRYVDFSGETPEIINDITSGSIVPKFRIRVSESIRDVIELSEYEMQNMTLDKFLSLDIKNKGKYVEKMILIPDPEAIIDVMGISIFNTGYAKSIRKNRDRFKKSNSFDLDFLIRTFINAPHIDSYNEFQFLELKGQLNANENMSWEPFKKNVLIPCINDVNENTEIEVKYKLIPSQKNWTHIKLIAKYKTNSLGFECERMGFDFLAYVIAVQHRFFQRNSLTGKFESFIASIQSSIYTSAFINDEETLYGKLCSEWKDYALKVFETEKKLKEIILENNDLLIKNNLEYDERRMCVMRYEIADDDNVLDIVGEEYLPKQRKLKKIIRPTYSVIDPMTSLKYLNELSIKSDSDKISITEFIPFAFATVDAGWVKIDTLDNFNEYKDLIRQAAYKKKISFFDFKDENKTEIFKRFMEKRYFSEFNKRFIELMEELGN